MVSLGRAPRLVSALQWYVVLGPSVAWAVQFVVGYGYTEGACGTAGVSAGVDLHLWQVILAVTMGLVALGGLTGAVGLHAAVGRGDVDDPLGRIRFLSTVGIIVGLIFVTAIIFNAAGTLALPECRR